MSSMSNDRQAGFSAVLLSLILCIVFLVGALGFGTWAFMSRQDYKNNSDQKASKAADERQALTEEVEAKKYAEEAKNPLTTHKAPDQYGSVTIQYPKTWSGYVEEGSNSGAPVDDYFHPAVVPDTTKRSNAYALRVKVVDEAYSSVLRDYENKIESQEISAAPYALPKVAGTIGTRLDGQIQDGKQGSLVVLPVRNMTLMIWTESPSFLADFNNIILPNLVFSP